MNTAVEGIRESIRREEYRAALGQWNSYACQLRAAAEAGTLPPDQWAEARALYEWSRGVLLGARAHLRARYRELEVAAAYRLPRECAPRRRGLLDARF
jgi:hypothetical protein